MFPPPWKWSSNVFLFLLVQNEFGWLIEAWHHLHLEHGMLGSSWLRNCGFLSMFIYLFACMSFKCLLLAWLWHLAEGCSPEWVRACPKFPPKRVFFSCHCSAELGSKASWVIDVVNRLLYELNWIELVHCIFLETTPVSSQTFQLLLI